MQINLTFEPSVANAPSGFKPALDVAVQYLDSQFSDPITVNISVGYGDVGGVPLGDSIAEGGPLQSDVSLSYGQLKSDLAADATSPADITSIADMAGDPTNGGTFFVSSAEAKALGLIASNATLPEGYDGQVGFGSNIVFDYDPNNRAAPNEIDFIGVAEHELTHAMGRVAGLQQAASETYTPLDLFRYSAPGVPELVAGQPAYFSIDGGNTDLDPFDTVQDDADWGPSVMGDSFGYGYTDQVLAVSQTDLEVMDVLGFTRPLTVAEALAAYAANPDMPSVQIVDSPANLSGAVDGLQTLTSHNKIASISLTDATEVSVSSSQLTADGATLALIGGPFNLHVSAGGSAFDYALAANIGGFTLSDETSASITGNARFDTITLGSGNDTVQAGSAGSDIVGLGDDELIGGAGNDTLIGEAGNDTMFGGAGSDYLYAGTGNSWLYGGSGNDVLIGGSGDDVLFGGTGNDTLYAETGHPYLYGGSGNDILIGGSNFDVLEAGNGNNYFYLESGGGIAYGGSGNDVYIGDPASTAEDIFVLGAGNNAVYGGGGDNYVYGGAGNDTMFGGYGGAGTDVFVGGAGNDYFDGGTGVNYYFGGYGGGPGTGLGNDTFALTDTGATQSVQVVQDWTEGKDHVLLTDTGLTSFNDVLSHSYQNGAYFVVQPDANNAIWLNGATAATVTASDFAFS